MEQFNDRCVCVCACVLVGWRRGVQEDLQTLNYWQLQIRRFASN
jgi:hypothetical protein